MKTEKYSNDRIRARKTRILKEARALIGSKGIDGLTMRELAKNSDVAFRTLYNLYGSKDVLVSYAVKDFLESIISVSVRKARGKPHLERLVTLLETIAAEVLRSSAYVRVLIGMYFKLDRPREIHQLLHNIVLSTFVDSLEAMSEDASLKEWTSVPLLAEEITEKVMWRIFQWAQAGISDKDLGDFLKFSVLQILSGSLQKDLTAAADARQEKIIRKLLKKIPLPAAG